ncbi:L,D-transpeptidase [Promineifilum sp.]|uniref:L,D-transpeptidase n=1 Tax=Promineifilum sp. TaxID=2664178 RepID=UPI0035B44980
MMSRIRLPLVIALAGLALFLMTRSTLAAANCYVLSSDIGYVCDTNAPPSPYTEPPLRPDSTLPGKKYGRLVDNINVYAEPDMDSPIVRNAGDGYLWHSIEDTANNSEEGRLWYMIDLGEWVRAEDIKLGTVSEFSGVEVRTQPHRPFGWVLVDFEYSEAPGAEPGPTAIKLPRYTPVEVYGAAVDEEGWIWYDIGHGRWMKQTYVSIIDLSPRPAEVGPDEYWVEVDLYEQNFAAYEGDRMVYAGLVSSGLNRWPTYEGIYQVWERHLATMMTGAEGKIDYYVNEDVPHTMYFNVDIALHGAYWHDRFGYKHSHGCVNMPPRDAEWIYFWSENAPNDLWVWVHTSDPHNYFKQTETQVEFEGAGE